MTLKTVKTSIISSLVLLVAAGVAYTAFTGNSRERVGVTAAWGWKPEMASSPTTVSVWLNGGLIYGRGQAGANSHTFVANRGDLVQVIFPIPDNAQISSCSIVKDGETLIALEKEGPGEMLCQTRL